MPSGSSVKVSLPGIEPGPRPSQGRMQIRHTPRTFAFQYLADESNVVLELRRLPCESGTLARCLFSGSPSRSRTWSRGLGNRCALQNTYGPQYPDLDSNQDPDLRRVRCNPLHHRDSIRSKSRRLDSHQHEPAYKAGAFLSRATSAFLGADATSSIASSLIGRGERFGCVARISTSARSRTPSVSFGD